MQGQPPAERYNPSARLVDADPYTYWEVGADQNPAPVAHYPWVEWVDPPPSVGQLPEGSLLLLRCPLLLLRCLAPQLAWTRD